MIHLLLALLLLGAIQLPARANAVPLTAEDVKILISLNNKFKCQYDKEKKVGQQQYAVFYYGEPEDIDKINLLDCKLAGKDDVFLIKPDYTLDPYTRAQKGCSFTAAKLRDTSSKHTEKSCLYSFGQIINMHISYTRCPTGPQKGKGNVYLISYRNPCATTNPDPDEKACTTVISHFAKDCGPNFRHLIIGYQDNYQNTEDDSVKVIGQIPNVGMKKIDFPDVPCPHMFKPDV